MSSGAAEQRAGTSHSFRAETLLRCVHPLPPPAPGYGSTNNFAGVAREDGGWIGGRAGPVGPCRRPCKLGDFRPGRREVPPHQEMIGNTIAATLEHQRSGRSVALMVGDAADLGGLTPPALSAPHPLPPVPPKLGFSVVFEGCYMQGRPELGGARRHSASGTHARVCRHAHVHTPMHTRCGHRVGHASALSHSLAFRASWSLNVCADAPLCAHVCTRMLPGRTLLLTHAVRPCASHSSTGKG